MAFSEMVRQQIYGRSSGQCECSREHQGQEAPHHGGRCPSTFRYSQSDAFEIRHIVPESEGGKSLFTNSEVLCAACNQLVGAEAVRA
jgi:5-methylcytosine-specific restriction endonuclease McrA